MDEFVLFLIVGDSATAVEKCIAGGRMADALILAASGGPELFMATRARYLATHCEPFMKVFSQVKDQQLDEVVAAAELSQWQETLGKRLLSRFCANYSRNAGLLIERNTALIEKVSALIAILLTYAGADQLSQLVERLGTR